MAVIKIAQRGSDSGNLIRYLFGKGRHNEHTNQRTIAGTTHAHSGAWDKQSIHQIVTDLRAFSQANPQSQIGPENKHVWHAAISLPPGEKLDDKGWAQLAQEYMRGMGLEDPAKAPIRWTAVHHGVSREGNDHIHIVMSMIRQDGSKVRIHNDAKTSRTVLTGIEQRLGLQVLQPSPTGARPITYKAGERGKAEKTGNPIEREDLASRIRALASTSLTEAEFVRRVRAAGLDIRPRVEGTSVTGYSVSFPGGIGFAGGKLGRDLTLPRLRQGWKSDKASRESGAAEWLRGSPGNPLVKYGRENQKNVPLPGDVKQELANAHFRLASADAAEFAAISADLSGVLSLASAHDPRLAALAKEVGRAAQTPEPFSRRRGSTFLNVGLLVLAITDADPRTRELLMLRQVVATLVTLVQVHRTRATAITNGRSIGMPQPDATDEAVELGVTTAVTLGAATVQMVLQRMGPRRPVEATKDAAAARGYFPGSGPVITPLIDGIDLRRQVEIKMEALGLPYEAQAQLNGLAQQDLQALAGRLSETIAVDPVAQNREALLIQYDGQMDSQAWVRNATPDQLASRVMMLESNGTLGVRIGATPAQDQAVAQAQEQQRGRVPNWKSGGEPMTPNQRFTLRKLCERTGLDPHADLTVRVDGGQEVPFRNFTKAQASGAISELQELVRERNDSPLGVGNRSVQSAAAQAVIIAAPAVANAPHVQPESKNMGGKGRF